MKKKKRNYIDYHLQSSHEIANNLIYLMKKIRMAAMFNEIKDYVMRCLTCAKADNELCNTKNKIIETKIKEFGKSIL